MKTILLPIHDDAGAEARLQVALDLARAHSAHLSCLQVTPLTAYVASDSFGGVFVMPDLIDAVSAHEAKLRADTEARLGREDVAWSYEHGDGDPAATIVDRSSLADLIVLSAALREPRPSDPLPLAGDVAIHARTPVCVVPATASGLDVAGKALVAWNGSAEAAAALKAALPMLRLATSVVIATVAEPSEDSLPPLDAAEYLSRHGVKAELLPLERGRGSIADTLLAARDRAGAAYVVMGAYGHSRMREFILGGVTREMLRGSPTPLFLAH
jgi:nucleotide-binding universal stress UspA family protein